MHISQAIQYLYPNAEFFTDWQVCSVNGVERISKWNDAIGLKPTAEQMSALGNDPAFQIWLAEHGGDQTLTKRRLAAEHIDQATCDGAILRAIVLLTVDQLKALRGWITSFKAATASATSLADLKSRVAALDSLPTLTSDQAKTAIKNKIAAGDTD